MKVAMWMHGAKARREGRSKRQALQEFLPGSSGFEEAKAGYEFMDSFMACEALTRAIKQTQEEST